jgi:hypothetical protein
MLPSIYASYFGQLKGVFDKVINIRHKETFVDLTELRSVRGRGMWQACLSRTTHKVLFSGENFTKRGSLED